MLLHIFDSFQVPHIGINLLTILLRIYLREFKFALVLMKGDKVVLVVICLGHTIRILMNQLWRRENHDGGTGWTCLAIFALGFTHC